LEVINVDDVYKLKISLDLITDRANRQRYCVSAAKCNILNTEYRPFTSYHWILSCRLCHTHLFI